ncbi:MAG: nitroreductase family protein [Treponema sp.]|nr:nitroreductase family protein [Treponema sp.]
MKKTILFFVVILLLGAGFLSAQSADNPALKPILNNFGSRNYATGAVTKAELDLIIQAGVRAPSASNKQPWHFTVVQDQALASKIIPQITDGNVLIVVSAEGDGKTNGSVMLDCGLATENMYLAAQALGLGSRIYSGPMNTINTSLKPDLGIPATASAIALVRVGRLPAGVDVTSSASPRNSVDKVVSYK